MLLNHNNTQSRIICICIYLYINLLYLICCVSRLVIMNSDIRKGLTHNDRVGNYVGNNLPIFEGHRSRIFQRNATTFTVGF